jgi:ribosomal-protein-alanine N-acetyltransferase
MVSSGFELREYRSSDLLAMFRLDQVCFERRFRFSLHAMRDFAEAPNAISVVAEVDGAMVGFAITEVGDELPESLGSRAYLMTLDVDPAWWRKGVAQALMEYLEARAWELAVRRMSLHVFVGNAAAIAFYERIGFRRIGRNEGFYGDGVDAYFYLKRLIGPTSF